VHVVRLGIDALFFDGFERSANLNAAAHPTVISDRALEPLYNVDIVLRAFARLRRSLPEARLVVAHEGSRRAALEGLSRELGLAESVSFVGRLDPADLLAALHAAQVYVSVPRSDAFALSTMEAMAAGCFPVVSDLLSVEGMIEHGVNGLRVPAGDVEALADALQRALTDEALRRQAASINRARVEAEGRLEANMLAMERHYYRLAGHPVGGAEAI
jgi:glycosyltransferase involved in cell wall biosynthesis